MLTSRSFSHFAGTGVLPQLTINAANADLDSVFHGTSNNLLFLDASTNRVGVGTNVPNEKFHLSSGSFQLDNARGIRWFDSGASDGDSGQIFYASDESFRFTANALERMRILANGDIAIGRTSAAAQLDIHQPSATGAQPVVKLEQADIDDTFINFVGTSAADGTRSISSDTTEDSAKFGAYRVEINGVTKWVRIYDDES